jgi:hypothetical protein
VKYLRVLLPYLPLPPENSEPNEWAVKDLNHLKKPDVVVATPVNHRFSGELEYVKAAKSMGIPTVIINQSWDNLTTKGLYHVVPDLLLVWNEAQKKEAVEIHGIPEENIAVTGAPFFDKWFHHRQCEDRKEFCDKVGLNHKKPFVLYLGSSSKIAEDETWLIKDIHDGLEGVGLLVRPHPANTKHYSKLIDGFVPYPSNGSLKIKDDFVVYPIDGELPEDEGSQQDFYNALKQCVCVIGINTSGMIDAVINGKPCIAFMSNKYRLTQRETAHFQQMIETAYVAFTPEKVAYHIARLIGGEDDRWSVRKKFVKQFIRPRGLDRKAGEIAAQEVERIANAKVHRLLHRQQT